MARRAFVFGSNGSGHYNPLKYAKRDAANFAACLARPGCDFDVVPAEQTSKPWALLEQLTEQVNACQEDDVFVCYFSGHGALEKNQLFLILDNSDPDSLNTTALAAAYVLRLIESCRAHNKLLVLDCCHAGAAVGKSIVAGGPDVSDLKLDENHLTLLAGKKLERAREFDDLKGSFLTHEMCDILTKGSGAITAEALSQELRARAGTRNLHTRDKVPLPFLHGFHAGSLALRQETQQEVVVQFIGTLHPDIPRLSATLSSYAAWTSANLIGSLPIVVRWPSEIQDYLALVEQYATNQRWPPNTPDQDKLSLENLVSVSIPARVAELRRAVGRTESLAKRSFVGAEHLTPVERESLLDLYIRSKTLSVIRLLCSTRPETWPHKAWMERYFSLATDRDGHIIAGLPSVVHIPSIVFWTNAELTIGERSASLFIPSTIQADDGSLVLDRISLLKFILPQVVDVAGGEEIAASLLVDASNAAWTLTGSAVIEPHSFELGRADSHGIALLRRILKTSADSNVRDASFSLKAGNVLTRIPQLGTAALHADGMLVAKKRQQLEEASRQQPGKMADGAQRMEGQKTQSAASENEAQGNDGALKKAQDEADRATARLAAARRMEADLEAAARGALREADTQKQAQEALDRAIAKQTQREAARRLAALVTSATETLEASVPQKKAHESTTHKEAEASASLRKPEADRVADTKRIGAPSAKDVRKQREPGDLTQVPRNTKTDRMPVGPQAQVHPTELLRPFMNGFAGRHPSVYAMIAACATIVATAVGPCTSSTRTTNGASPAQRPSSTATRPDGDVPSPSSRQPPPAVDAAQCKPLGELGCTDGGCCESDSLACASTQSNPAPHCCLKNGASCNSGSDCCGLMDCVDGACACRPFMTVTLRGADCCSGESDDRLGPDRLLCCMAAGAACTGNDDCCGAMFCQDSICVN